MAITTAKLDPTAVSSSVAPREQSMEQELSDLLRRLAVLEEHEKANGTAGAGSGLSTQVSAPGCIQLSPLVDT